MKVQELIDNAGSIIENGVENRAQFDDAMLLYGNLVREAARAAAAARPAAALFMPLPETEIINKDRHPP